MVNKVTLIGHLGKDPEVRRLENGMAVAKFSIATSEGYKDKNGEWQSQTEWHDVVAWRLLAERAEEQLKTGKLVYVDGKLTHRKWQDKDGNNRYTTEVVANTFRVLEKKEGGGGYSSNFPGTDSAPPERDYEERNAMANSKSATTSATTTAPPQADREEDDLPF